MTRSRRRGAGSLQQLPDGRVRAFLPRQGRDGPRPSAIFTSQAEAQAWLDEATAPPSPIARGPSQPLGRYLIGWYSGLTLAEQTAPNYQRAIRYCGPLLETPLNELTHRDFAALWAAWQRESPGRSGRPLAASTVQQLRVILSAALNAAVPDLIPANPIRRARVQRHATRVDPPHWDKADAQRFLRAAADSFLYALFMLALSIGARPGELRGLRWEDLDLDAGTVLIRRSLTAFTLTVKGTKTGRERLVELPPPCVAALRQHRARQAVVSPWVFCRDDGQPLQARHLSAEYHRLRREAGVPPMIMYGLRHSAATIAMSDGVPLPVVSEMLGHSSPATTVKVYWRSLSSQRKMAAQIMAEAFPFEGKTRSRCQSETS